MLARAVCELRNPNTPVPEIENVIREREGDRERGSGKTDKKIDYRGHPPPHFLGPRASCPTLPFSPRFELVVTCGALFVLTKGMKKKKSE